MSSLTLSSALAPSPVRAEKSATHAAPAPDFAGVSHSPDAFSGHLAAWTRTRAGASAPGKTAPTVRRALPAFFAQATQTAAYKSENDDASFVERLANGTVVAGLFDGVTVPSRNHRAGHAICASVRERLRGNLLDKEDPHDVENVLANVIDEAVGLLEKLGGGAATTATVIAAVPLPTREWYLHVINAGNSRATAFMPDGTLDAITRVKPPGTPFAAVNTLSRGYAYKLEMSKLILPEGTLLLLTSDGIHDHIPDSRLWRNLGGAVEKAIARLRSAEPNGVVERLVRDFAVRLVEDATAAQERMQQTDDATAFALVLGDPTAALLAKSPRS